MPDAHGNFRGMSVPADAWERIFGKKENTPYVIVKKWSNANSDKRPTDK